MARKDLHIFLVVSLSAWIYKINASSKCLQPDTIDHTLRQAYRDQPLFATFITKYPEFQLLDSSCVTLFPLPDNPDTFTIYQSQVFCDGSYDITTFIGTVFGIGENVLANPYGTLRQYITGYAGCDSYIFYACSEFSATDPAPSYVAGFSSKYQPIGLSCLRKVQEILHDRCLPEEDYYVLPMKLPHRCVTQQLCLQPPNPFYNKLPSVALY